MSKTKKKVTMQDVINEMELESLGLTESIDGSPVNSSRKIWEFLHDIGMRETPEYLEIQARYHDKMRDKEERQKYFREMAHFIKQFFRDKANEYLESQK